MLRENGVNSDNYVGLPYNGGIRYYREDYFDDVSQNDWDVLIANAVPYDKMLGEDPILLSGIFDKMRERRAERVRLRRENRSNRRADRRGARQDRIETRQGSRSDRTSIRQENRTQRREQGGGPLDLVKGLIGGDQTGGTVSFGGGQGIQIDGQAGFGADKNFITTDSIIGGVPNYFILGGGAVAGYLLLKK